MDIGTIISQRRIELGLTLEELGEKVGVTKSTVKKWESGYIKNMGRDKIQLLADALSLNPVTFVTGEMLIIEKKQPTKLNLTAHEKSIIEAYREHPEMQEAVDKLLGVPT